MREVERQPLLQFEARTMLIGVTLAAVACAVVTYVPDYFIKAFLAWSFFWMAIGWIGLGMHFNARP